MWLVLHAGQEDSYNAIQVLEDQFWYDLQHILDDSYKLIGVELGNTFNIWAFGHEEAHHGYVEDGAKLHESVFEQECDARRLSDFFLHEAYVILESDPTPCDI